MPSLSADEARCIVRCGDAMSSVKDAWFRHRKSTDGFVAFFLHHSGSTEMFPSMEHFRRKYPDSSNDDGGAAA